MDVVSRNKTRFYYFLPLRTLITGKEHKDHIHDKKNIDENVEVLIHFALHPRKPINLFNWNHQGIIESKNQNSNIKPILIFVLIWNYILFRNSYLKILTKSRATTLTFLIQIFVKNNIVVESSSYWYSSYPNIFELFLGQFCMSLFNYFIPEILMFLIF